MLNLQIALQQCFPVNDDGDVYLIKSTPNTLYRLCVRTIKKNILKYGLLKYSTARFYRDIPHFISLDIVVNTFKVRKKVHFQLVTHNDTFNFFLLNNKIVVRADILGLQMNARCVKTWRNNIRPLIGYKKFKLLQAAYSFEDLTVCEFCAQEIKLPWNVDIKQDLGSFVKIRRLILNERCWCQLCFKFLYRIT